MIVNWPLKKLGLTNSIISDFLNEEESIKPYFNKPSTIEGIQEVIQEKKFPVEKRKVLVEVIQEQFAPIDDGSELYQKSRQNIQSLLNSDTYSVTTGQQLHLFLGPGYFIHKIFSCIKLAQEVQNANKTKKIVPVFWLASEDHDTEEIMSVELFGKDFNASLKPNQITGEQETSQLYDLISQLEERLGDEASTCDLFQICKSGYKRYDKLSSATAYIIYTLFAEFGIIVLDANDKRLKSQFESILENEIKHETTTHIQNVVKEDFDLRNWHYQVMPRSNNLFKIDSNGIRTPCTETTYNKDDTYSPNALLRPIYQEIILPNVAYVGGLAEINYWLQLKPVFDSYNITFPVIWARDVLHHNTDKKIQQLINLSNTIEKIAQFDENDFEKNYAEEHIPKDLIQKLNNIQKHLNQISTDLPSKIWKELSISYDKILIDIKKEYRSLKRDILAGNEYQQRLRRIKNMQETFFNKAQMQERTRSCLSLGLNFNQIPKLKEVYLEAPIAHAEYYIIGN